MASRISPSETPCSPTLLYRGQEASRQLQPTLDASAGNPTSQHSVLNNERGDPSGIQGWPMKQWPGFPVSDDQTATLCPDTDCRAAARLMWNGLNVDVPPFSRNKGEIPLYGKTPEAFRRATGHVGCYTLVLWSCPKCQKWWYNYLFHTTTHDGRAPLGTQMAQAETLTPPPPAHSRSTLGRTSSDIQRPLWNHATAEPISGLQKHHRKHTGKREVVIHQDRPVSTKWTSSTNVHVPVNPILSTAPSAFLFDVSKGDVVSTPPPTPGPTRRNAGPPVLNVNTNIPSSTHVPANDSTRLRSDSSRSRYSSRTLGPVPSGRSSLAPSPMPHSPSGFSPTAPPQSAISIISPAPSSSGISPIRRKPTQPPSPPPKKVQRDPGTYLFMRKHLACDECRRRKKRCDMNHSAPRRPWGQRLDRKEQGGALVGERSTAGSPIFTPDLSAGEWMEGHGNGQDGDRWSPSDLGVSQSPEVGPVEGSLRS